MQALLSAADDLAWRQTYTEGDGFERAYLDRYGWFDLCGPKVGPFVSQGFRLMGGYWGQGLVYPDHAHPPEEHYIVIAGGARFRLGDDPWKTLGPGEIFHTPPGAVHSADMSDGPLVALSIWQADDLRVRIDLPGSGHEVVRE
ncbi:MAG: dimethylsulfonioproprionate lyase family protein [Pseudomonadota bacterium]